VYKPSLSLLEFADLRLLKGLLKMDVLSNMRKHVSSVVSHPFLQELMEFPVLFLGALPENTPALYSLMNHADFTLGTWYPQGGMFNIIEAFLKVAQKQGAQLCLNQEVVKIISENGIAKGVQTHTDYFEADVVIGAADYHHLDQKVLEPAQRNYTAQYWDKRKLAPSCLLYYVGLNKRLKNAVHHTLFFDTDFGLHAQEIYTQPKWPSNPLFYASVPSVTDPSVAPAGCENLFLLIPIAPGITGDTEDIREAYFVKIIKRLEQQLGESILPHVVYKRSYSVSDFKNDYHAFKGNAYGLANTLDQTAILKPSLKSKKIKNLYFAGQLTVPGPGVPPSIISGKVAATQIFKEMGN
jgi:phytoene desaturase